MGRLPSSRFLAVVSLRPRQQCHPRSPCRIHHRERPRFGHRCSTEWDAFDLRTHAGLSIEVKSCAYLQSWEQNRLSTITFSIRETRAWDSVTGLRQSEALRQAQLYIFALLIHQEGKATLDPLNLDQWRFYPVLTSKLNERSQGQQSLGLRALEALCPVPLHFNELRTAVRELEAGLGLAASSGANE